MAKLLSTIFSLILLCLACGGDDPLVVHDFFEEADGGLSTAAQPLYMPLAYGTEKSGGKNVCAPPWSGGECFVPESKTMIVGFMAATCSAWWQARFVEVWNYMTDTALPSTNWYLLPPQDIGFGQSVANYQMYCNSAADAAYGAFKPYIGNGTTDDHDTPEGTLREYHQGELYVGLWPIETSKLWRDSNDAARRRFARSLIWHEMGHMFGHGHNPGHPLMDGARSFEWYATERTWDTPMYDAMTEYNPENDALFPDYCEETECDGVAD